MKRINIFLGGLAALSLSSCFSDKSNYDYLQPVDIRVEDLVSCRQRAVDPGGAVKRDRCDVRAGNSVVEGVDVPK